MASMEEKNIRSQGKKLCFSNPCYSFYRVKKMVFGTSIDEINSHRPIEGGTVREGPKLFWLEGTSEVSVSICSICLVKIVYLVIFGSPKIVYAIC